MFGLITLSMTIVLKRLESDRNCKQQVCIKGKIEICNMRESLDAMRIQVQQTFKSIQETIRNVEDQIQSRSNEMCFVQNQKLQRKSTLLQESLCTLKRNRLGLSDKFQQSWMEVSTKNRQDIEEIVSVVRVISASRNDLQNKLSICLLKLERSNIMCQQYKELFEQEQVQDNSEKILKEEANCMPSRLIY